MSFKSGSGFIPGIRIKVKKGFRDKDRSLGLGVRIKIKYNLIPDPSTKP